MLKLQFVNAVVKDDGYGLEVNGKELNNIISTALGTRVGKKCGYGSGIPSFNSNCCNVTIIIDPQPSYTIIEDNDKVYTSLKEMEDAKREQFKKDEERDPEE